MAEEIETTDPSEYNQLSDMPSDQSLEFSNDDFNTIDPPTKGAKPEAIDVYKKNVGNPITGSNPAAKYSDLNTIDYGESLADAARHKIETSADDPYTKMRPYTYSGDYDGANFERYYGTRLYNKLGFSPYRDNDALYNKHMTMGDQFVRAASQWDNLALGAFVGSAKAWGTLFTDPLSPDIESARDFERAMAIGSVTTGGVGGFVANTFLNSAYSIGMATEFLAEEFALAAATAYSGGMAGAVTLPAMFSKAGVFTKGLVKLGEMGAKVGKNADRFADAKKVFEAGTKIQDFGKAASNVNGFRQVFNKVASGAADMLLPLDNTISALKKTNYINDYAKTVGVAGAFIDDMIQIKTGVSEAVLEGGMVKLTATKDLIDQYRDINGTDPEGEDLANIEAIADHQARVAAYYNLPAIMVTNKLLFSTMMLPLTKMMGNAGTKLIENIAAEGGMKALKQNPYSVIGQSAGAQIKAAAKSLIKPKTYGKYGMTYLTANFAEGIQENLQEAISQGAIDHALEIQRDPGMAAYQGYMAHFLKGAKDQISAQGAETFASGFLMGMFVQPIMSMPAYGIAKGAKLFQNKEKMAEIQRERDEALNAERDALNDLANNDILYWSPDLGTAIKNKALAKDIFDAASIGDYKSAKTAKDLIKINHVITAASSGKFDQLMDKLKDYKNLTPKEALEAFKKYNIGVTTEAEAAEALNYIDDVVDRAYKIKDRFEEVAQKFPNPVNINKYKKGTAAYDAAVNTYNAWSEAQKNLVFARSMFDSYNDRVRYMSQAFSELSQGIAKADAQGLMATMSMANLTTEISTLKKEIKSLSETEVEPGTRRDKETKLKLLENFKESITEAQEKIRSGKITDYSKKRQIYAEAEKDFKKYLQYLSKKNETIYFTDDANKAFSLLTDNLEMKDELQGLANSINVLNDPKGFLHLAYRLKEAYDTSLPDRIKTIYANLDKFMLMQDEEMVLQELGRLGLKLPENFIEQYKDALDKGEPLPDPEVFIDPATDEEISMITDPDKYDEAADLWVTYREWLNRTRPAKAKEDKEEEEEETKETTIKPFDAKDYTTFTGELKSTIDSLYAEALKINSSLTIEDFITSSPEAIIAINLEKSKEIEKKEAELEAKRLAAEEAARKKAEEEARKKAEEEEKRKKGVETGKELSKYMINKAMKFGFTETELRAMTPEEQDTIRKAFDKTDEAVKALFTKYKPEVKDQDWDSLIAKAQNDDDLFAIMDQMDDAGVDITREIEEKIAKRREEIESGKTEVVEEPIDDIYKGQLVFMTPGSGKSYLASKNSNVIDADMLLIETASQLNPEFKPNPDATGFQNINKALQFVDRQDLYNKTFNKIQALKKQGKTVVTGSRAFIKFADFVMVQSDKNITQERIKDGYDMNIELDEINKLQQPFIAVSGYAAGVLKLTPKELIALNVPAYKAESEDNTEDDLDETPITLQEINQNINFENLAISMDRGYDVIVKNNRFTIVKINKKSVTLKDLAGNSVRVKPEEITMVVDGKGVTATGEEIDTVNNNKDILTKAEVEPTKGLTKEELLERIKNNNCKPTS
jgi:hypothetical protein